MSRDAMVAFTRGAALACAIGLVALGLGGELVWARIGHGTLVLKVLPLVAALPGLSRLRLRTYRWVSLLVWLYAAEGALRLRDPAPAGPIAVVELLLALGLFTCCALHVRARLGAARDPAAEATR
ncbi:MAG TPA: DUF2069 domain-containing protein [Burkholderiaceae bacterium]|nr:DUF2069 domain-containing protein [Burkholderiaceae bacterium]